MSHPPFEFIESLRIGTVDFVSPDEIKVALDIEAPESVALNLLSAHLKRHFREISWPRFELVRRKRAGGEPACPHIVQPRFPRQAVALVCGRYRE
jgi:hypothetical protein